MGALDSGNQKITIQFNMIFLMKKKLENNTIGGESGHNRILGYYGNEKVTVGNGMQAIWI